MTGHVNLLSPTSPQNAVYQGTMTDQSKLPNMRRATGWADLIASAETDEVELAVWERRYPSPAPASDTRDPSEFEIILGERKDILAGFTDTFNASAWPDSLREILEQGVYEFLAAVEAKLPDSHYRLRLQAVSDDACRKFHQDRVFQRLIVTYRGDGTVWRHTDDIDTDDAETHSEMAGQLDCVLLRGKRGEQQAKIQHKSPIFTEGNPPRLILVIDVIPSL